MNYGPKVDVCAEMRKECLKAGLRWGVRTHLARSYSWFQTNKGADKEGDKMGVPYDGNNPDYEDLYIEKAAPEQIGEEYNQIRHPLIPSEKWVANWKNRMFDLIDNYHPDHFYFDGALPFMNDNGRAGMEVIAHYYNHNASLHNGVNEGVMMIKDIKDHGYYYDKISSVVLERTRENKIVMIPRETENSTGPWFYTGVETGYRSSESLLHEMIDVVSKNCNFVLNIPPRPDGAFDDSSLKILKDFGKWLRKNGEAIYSSRPWKTFGEGDVRFTVKGKNLYAIYLNKPAGKTLIRSMHLWQSKDIESVELVGSNEKVDWELSNSGLKIKPPKEFEDELAYVFKIRCSQLPSELPYAEIDLQSTEEDNKKNNEGQNKNVKRYGMVIKIKPEKIEEYKELHANPWPGVSKMIAECNIRNYSIFLMDSLLFGYLEYTGTDFEADMVKMAADSLTREWWKKTDPCQIPFENRKEGEWWSMMEEVFHLD